MNELARFRMIPLLGGVLAMAHCAVDGTTSKTMAGSSGLGGAGGVGGSASTSSSSNGASGSGVGGSASSVGASSTGVSGSTGGSSGSIGGSGTTGGSAGSTGAGGGATSNGGASVAGAGGRDGGGGAEAGPADATVEAAAEASPPCPGAGKSLRFVDDLAGSMTQSTQLLADLGTDLPIGNTARTIEMWLYMEGNESWKAEHSIVEYGGQGRCQAFGIDGGDTGMSNPAQFDPFTFSQGGPCSGDNNVALSPAPPRTGWLHLAWSYDPMGNLSYGGQTNLNFLFTVNGAPQPISAKTQTGGLLTMRTVVSIGSGQTTNNGFTGKMDEFRFWNVARTAQEIADSYRLILKGDEPGLVAYYHFDDATGSTARDASSKHHDAMFAAGANRPAPAWVDSTGLTLTCKP